MKKIIYIILFIQYSIQGIAQPYFSDTLNTLPISLSTTMGDVFELPNQEGYAVSHFANYKFNLIYTNIDGQRVRQQSWQLFDSLVCSFYTRTSTPMPNGNYAISVLLTNPSETQYYGGIIMMNNDLTDTLWTRRYKYENLTMSMWQNFFYAEAANDETIWVAGTTVLNNGNVLIVTHLSSSGSVLSQQHYNLSPGYPNAYPNHILATPDGGCIIGITETQNILETTFQASFLKVNASGQQEWYKQYGNIGKVDEEPFVVKAPNPNEYWLIYSEAQSTAMTEYSVKYKAIRVNHLGVTLETKYINTSKWQYQPRHYDTYQAPNGDVYFGGYRSMPPPVNDGYIWRLSNNLDSISLKQLPRPNKYTIGYEQGFPYHIIGSSVNDDIICSGYYYNQGPNSEGIFLARLNSDGIVSTSPPAAPQAEGSIKVYPNPANDILNIEIENKDVSLSYKIYDMLGRQVQDGALNNGLTINIKNLTNGVYFLSISDKNGGVYRAVRFVVQRE